MIVDETNDRALTTSKENTMIISHDLQRLLPLTVLWAEEQEKKILDNGYALSRPYIQIAKEIGIEKPKKIRIWEVEDIPLPDNPELKEIALAADLISPNTIGLTLGHGIFVRKDCQNDQRLIIHELVHTMQYEKMGGFTPFLSRYLQECLSVGYQHAAMEQEAIRIEKDIWVRLQ